jgi:hypothetical protein
VEIDPQSFQLFVSSMDDIQTGQISAYPNVPKSDLSLMDDTQTHRVSIDLIPLKVETDLLISDSRVRSMDGTDGEPICTYSVQIVEI